MYEFSHFCFRPCWFEDQQGNNRIFPPFKTHCPTLACLYLDIMQTIITEYPCFFTASVLKHQFLFTNRQYKDILLDSLRFLCVSQRIRLFAFAIMSNHIHLIWQILPGHKPSDVQRDFLKYTAGQLQKDLMINNPELLEKFRTDKADRRYQFWQRNSLSIELRSKHVFDQQLNYINQNPVKAGLSSLPERYHYSSAALYHTGVERLAF